MLVTHAPSLYNSPHSVKLKLIITYQDERINEQLQACCYRQDDLVCVIIINNEYPNRVIFELILHILDNIYTIQLSDIIKKSQNPEDIDTISKINKDLKETNLLNGK